MGSRRPRAGKWRMPRVGRLMTCSDFTLLSRVIPKVAMHPPYVTARFFQRPSENQM